MGLEELKNTETADDCKRFVDAFQKMFPNADYITLKNGEKYPRVCRVRLYGGTPCNIGMQKSCYECWSEPCIAKEDCI